MKLIIDVDDNDYELLNKTGIEMDWNTAWNGKEKDREITFALFDLVKALKNGTPYEQRPQGEWVYTEKEDKKKGYGGYCSVCKCDMPIGINDWKQEYYESKFCPNCGADMRGGEEND